MGLTVKNEDGQYFIKSGTGWYPVPKRITTFEELQNYTNCTDIELIRTSGQRMRTLEVLSYDGMSVTIKDDSGQTSQNYLPMRTKQEMIDYLIEQEQRKGYNQIVVKVNSSETDNYTEPEIKKEEEKIIISAPPEKNG